MQLAAIKLPSQEIFRVRTTFFSAIIFCCAFASAQSLVSTQYGTVQGAQNGNVIQFLGIPFAKPPVDSLRWRAPQPPDSWANILNANAFKPACAQKSFSQTDTVGKVTGSEDCLYLNVWTPQIGSGTRPVMVFIHGGGNQQGSANDTASNTALYFGKNLSERGDVVVVTIQYRLGALGYLVHPGLEAESSSGKAGNYAVLDHILALKWVKHNIHQFGGDTSNITIFGESAGGVNVGNLMLTNEAAGLFHRAIIQSAVPNISVYNDEKNKGIQFVNSFPLATGTDAQKIAYLRALPADSLTAKYTSPLTAGLLTQNFQPTLDGILFSKLPTQAIESGDYNKVPVIIGSNSDEMSLSAPLVVTPAMVTQLINARIPAAFRQEAAQLYPPGTTNAEARRSYVDITSDGQFNAPVRRIARCLSLNQTEPVWDYWFTHAHTVPQLAQFGAYHGIELFYVFNTLENSTIGTGALFKPADDSVQKATRTYWTNFAQSGNPNNGVLPAWVTFEAGQDCYMEIKATPDGTQCKIHEARLDFWDRVVGFNSCKPVGVNDFDIDNHSVSVYPNPSNGIWHIETMEKIDFWEVSNLKGQVTEYGKTQQVDLSKLGNGIYFLRVKCSQTTSTHKLIKF